MLPDIFGDIQLAEAYLKLLLRHEEVLVAVYAQEELEESQL